MSIHLTQYKYRATAFSGIRSFSGVETGGSRVCSVVACTEDALATCGHRFENYVDNSTAIFEELTIIGTVPTPAVDLGLDADNSTFLPVHSTVSIMPLEPQEYFYSSVIEGRTTTHSLVLTNRNAELYSFALWGRVFAYDGLQEDPPLPVEDPTVPGAARVHLLSPLLLLLALLGLARF